MDEGFLIGQRGNQSFHEASTSKQNRGYQSLRLVFDWAMAFREIRFGVRGA